MVHFLTKLTPPPSQMLAMALLDVIDEFLQRLAFNITFSRWLIISNLVADHPSLAFCWVDQLARQVVFKVNFVAFQVHLAIGSIMLLSLGCSLLATLWASMLML